MALDRVTQERIDYLMENATTKVWEPFPGVTVVCMQFENGFTLTDHSGCINPDNYDREIGVRICKEHIENRLWQLEGYVAKQGRYEEGLDRS